MRCCFLRASARARCAATFAELTGALDAVGLGARPETLTPLAGEALPGEAGCRRAARVTAARRIPGAGDSQARSPNPHKPSTLSPRTMSRKGPIVASVGTSRMRARCRSQGLGGVASRAPDSLPLLAEARGRAGSSHASLLVSAFADVRGNASAKASSISCTGSSSASRSTAGLRAWRRVRARAAARPGVV